MIESPFDNEPVRTPEEDEGLGCQAFAYNCCGCLFLIALGLGVWGIFILINWLHGGN